MTWQFKREESQFQEIPEGTYRVRINSAEMAVSKSSGNDMLVLKLDVSGTSSHLWNYITFLNDRPEITNRMLTQMFDSFDIEEGNFNLASYAGKVGGAVVKHDDQGRAKISYFIDKKKQENLPPWKEVSGQKAQSPMAGFAPIQDDEIQF